MLQAKPDPKMTSYKKFTIPSYIATRVPRHWLTFIDEAISEL